MRSTLANDDDDAVPVSQRFEAGDLIGGKYELVRQIGAGGMGSVWVALHKALETKVAVKLLHAEMRVPTVMKRAFREARATAMLSHSSIVRVFDLGETPDGDPFIVMELLQGESLRTRLEREG